jgi:transposase-like protein
MAKRGGRRRDPSRERSWRQTIRQQQHSGLNVRDFCRREGLKDGTFRWWRQELARRDRQTAGASVTVSALEPAEADTAAMFLPVRVVDQEAISPQPPPPIEIVWPTGPTLRVPAGFDRRALDEILTVLEGRRC